MKTHLMKYYHIMILFKIIFYIKCLKYEKEINNLYVQNVIIQRIINNIVSILTLQIFQMKFVYEISYLISKLRLKKP